MHCVLCFYHVCNYAACEVSNCDVCDVDTKICETCAQDYQLSNNECSELSFNFIVFSFLNFVD